MSLFSVLTTAANLPSLIFYQSPQTLVLSCQIALPLFLQLLLPSLDFPPNSGLEQLMEVCGVHRVYSRKPKLTLVTILKTGLISRKCKRTE